MSDVPEDLVLLLGSVELVDAFLDENAPQAYLDSDTAMLWRRVTKVCEESGEVWKALSRATGENPRLGVSGGMDDVLGELGDTALAALLAIQHVLKDPDATWAQLLVAARKARNRAARAGDGYEAERDLSRREAP